MKLVTRGIEEELRDVLAVSRAAPSPGPRQSGKSTLAKQQLRDVVPSSFSLDDEATRNAALAERQVSDAAVTGVLRIT